jgi:arylsulfate sulfotransferase
LHTRSLAISAPCVLLFWLAGCGSGSSGTTIDASENAASLSSSVTGTANPQVASYSVTLPKAGNVSVAFGPDTSYGFSTSEQHTPATGALAVNILVAGMKADTTYHMQAKVDYDDGTSTADTDQTFTTGALPTGVLPNFTVTATSGLTPLPGSLRNRSAGQRHLDL